MSGLIMPGGGLLVPTGTKTEKKFEFSDQKNHAEEIFERLGSLDDVVVNFSWLLVAKYIRTQIGTGLLEAAPDTQREDLYQSKVGLVLKKGPLAFVNRPGADFGGANAKSGDWVVYRMSDGADVGLRTKDGMNIVHCRFLHDAEIISNTASPDRIW